MSRSDYWEQFQSRNVARRRVLAGGALGGAGLASLALVGCGGDDDDGGTSPTVQASGTTASTGTTTAVTPKKGGKVVYNMGMTSSQSMDPHTTLSRAFFYWGLIGSKLLSPHAQTVEPIQPGLVESWEQPDQQTLIFHVRQGVKWHADKVTAGRAFTAEDVAYNLERITGKYDPTRTAQFQRASTLSGLVSAKAVDAKTAQVTLDRPNSQFLHGMADWRNWVVARENVEANPNFTNFGAIAGTGPFTVKKWDASQQIGEYEPSSNYYGPGPYLDKILQVSIPDAAAAQGAFLSGQIDFISAFSPDERKTLSGKSDVKIASWEHSGWEYFRLNQARPVFTDPRVRTAIFMALNYKQLLDSNYGEGFWSFSGPIPSGFPGAWTSDKVSQMPGYNPNTKDADIAEAKKMMLAATGKDGEIEFAITASPGAGTAWNNNAVRAQGQLQKIWPKMKVTIVGDQDFAGFSRNLATGAYDVITYGSFPPPSGLLEAALHYSSTGSRNYTKYTNTDVDRLIAKGLAEPDAVARGSIVGEVQQKLQDEIFAIPIGKRKGVFAYNSKIQGFEGRSGPGTFESYDPSFLCASLWFN